MPSAFVAISTAVDGNMFIPSHQDDKEVVTNRRSWLGAQNIAIEDAVRVNISYAKDDFCFYRIVDTTDKYRGMEDANVDFADALVTTTPGVALFLPVADCVATTIFDEEKAVLMLSHLGRHSLEQQGGQKSIEFLVSTYGVKPENLKVWLGPAPNKEAYPIFKLNNKGMKEAVVAQLAAAGIRPENVIDNPADTSTDNKYFSHSEFLKGNKPTDGRFAMVAMMQNNHAILKRKYGGKNKKSGVHNCRTTYCSCGNCNSCHYHDRCL
jgi:copper oxidase (laccase) domain-containing protein